MNIDEIEIYLLEQAEELGLKYLPGWIRDKFAEMRLREAARRRS